METRVIVPENEAPHTVRSVVVTLKSIKLKPRHDVKDWGDWIHFDDSTIVISIESNNGLTSSATIELDNEDDEKELEIHRKILKAFHKLGWKGEDEDGYYEIY